MALLTLSEYKALRGITGTTQDAQITAYLEPVEQEIIEFCNQDWGAGTDEEDFPAGLKLVAADMITFRLGGGITDGKTSENIDGYSYTREAVGDSGYPMGIEKGMSRYRVASVKYGRVMTQFRDRRDIGLKNLADGKVIYGVPVETE